jgi:hypothetical protein
LRRATEFVNTPFVHRRYRRWPPRCCRA